VIVKWTDEDYVVTLDDELVDSYHEANDEEGYVIVTRTRNSGTMPIFEGGRLVTERLEGKVVIARKQ
jgi:hypothetical protein